MQKITVPRLGMACPGGLIAEWYVPDGAAVEAGQPLFRLEAEFAAIDVEAESAGIVRHRVPAGIPQFSGAVVGVIVAPGEPIPSDEELAALDSRPTVERPGSAPVGPGAKAKDGPRPGVLPPYEPPRDPVPLRPRRRADAVEARSGGLWEAMAGGAPPGFGWDGEPPAVRPAGAVPAAETSPAAPVSEDPTPEPPGAEVPPGSEPSAESPAAEETVPEPSAEPAAEEPPPPPFEPVADAPAATAVALAAEGAGAAVAASRHAVRAVVALDDAHRLVRALRRQGVASATVESLAAWAIVRALAGEGAAQAAVAVYWLADGAWSAYEGSTRQPLADVAAALEARLPDAPETRDAVIVATRGTGIEEAWPGGEFGDVPVVVLGAERWEPVRARGGEVQWRFVATVTLSLPAEAPLAQAAVLLRQVARSLERPFELLVA